MAASVMPPPTRAPQSDCADYAEAGAGPLVVLVHCSMSGARQWSGLMQQLQADLHLRAVNLFGYGRTPAWDAALPPALDDFARLVLDAIPAGARDVTLVGHSFGGAVAMQAARRLGARAGKLVLIEPSIFYLLHQTRRDAAFSEIAAVADAMRQSTSSGAADVAAERFIGYWSGPAAWAASPPERKAFYARCAKSVLHEFGAVLTGDATPAAWSTALPPRTSVVWSADTVRPSREIVETLAGASAGWDFLRIPEGGHMAPLTHAHLVNPILGALLRSP